MASFKATVNKRAICHSILCTRFIPTATWASVLYAQTFERIPDSTILVCTFCEFRNNPPTPHFRASFSNGLPLHFIFLRQSTIMGSTAAILELFDRDSD
uniref:AlNc14C35G3132 protein n=1 Tax=Albugo laibachii Nc14 TaxID=890382 RepID=F0W8K6_9STRA|nr:AlNc14C35G3132 [Albugo laibachii Nc14]|eukprot:CCA17461.1 AlNc14C35G3132 [Albugo laibachii Nc14]